MLLIEDNDDQNDAEKENEEDDIDNIFENYFMNSKKSGFRRTTPADKPEKIQTKGLSCTICNFTTSRNSDLVEHIRKHTDETKFCLFCKYTTRHKTNFRKHMKVKHGSNLSGKTVRFETINDTVLNNRDTNGKESGSSSRTRIQYCHFWNNYGKCDFEMKHNKPCKFKHEEAPRCKFDGRCNRQRCMYKHSNQYLSFLSNTQRSLQHQVSQRGDMSSQNSWKVPFPHQYPQGGIRVWENTRNF